MTEKLAFTIECSPHRNVFVCKINEIQKDKIKPTTVTVTNISLNGCGGVYATIKPSVIRLKGSHLPLYALEQHFKQSPDFFKDCLAITAKIDRGKLTVHSVDPYPCE